MKYYAIYNTQTGQLSKAQCKCLNTECINIEISKGVYDNLEKFIYQDGEIVLDPDYEAKQAQAEAERVAKLYLTGADVERGIYQAIKMDFDDILAMVETLKQVQGDELAIDIKALKIELKANHFYRGNLYVSKIGELLGFTEGQLDAFFETNDYTYLLPNVNNSEETEESTEVDQVEDDLEVVE